MDLLLKGFVLCTEIPEELTHDIRLKYTLPRRACCGRVWWARVASQRAQLAGQGFFVNPGILETPSCSFGVGDPPVLTHPARAL